MAFYQDRVVPLLTDLAMRQRMLVPYRSRIVSAAEGRVLEIGIGSGRNLPFYSNLVETVVGLDPSSKLLSMARRGIPAALNEIDFIEGSAETIPLEDRSVDTVVSTWTLCTIPNVLQALHEMRRVLKPGGRLLFVEHGRAPDPGVRWWQDVLTPCWRRVGGGCHLNRPIATLIEDGGLRIERLETGYMRGPKPMTFMYEGGARA